MRRILATAVAVLAVVPALAFADPGTDVGFRGWGPRVGVTMAPDQIHFGVHADFGNFARRVRFQPNFELGFGDGLTFGALNAEAAYRFREKWDVWGPYLGGGIGANFTGSEDSGLRDGSETGMGLNVLGGIEKGLSDGDRFFTEAKLGFADSPDFKLTVGWTFYH